jgi:arylsulfatase A-like enzyme
VNSPNIIMILLDGARWDRLFISPEFSELGKKGTLLTNVTTTAPYTFASVNSIFTGLYGKENGVNAYYKMFRLNNNVDFLPEILKNNGYFTTCNLISDKVISSRGFDIHVSHDEYRDNIFNVHTDFLKKSFELAQNKPLFSFLQFSRIHTVTVSEILKEFEWDDKSFYEQKEQNLRKYDEVFIETGKYAKLIKQMIEDLGKTENTILVFFSDHGTGIGERFGERNYGVFTFEETIRTFYLFIGPEIKQNQENDTVLSTRNILPTLLEFLKINITNSEFSPSFKPYLTGKIDLPSEESFCFSETGSLQGPFPSPKEPNVFCIKNSKFKLVFYKTINKWNFFDLVNDPKEEQDIVRKNLSIEIEMREKLMNWMNR